MLFTDLVEAELETDRKAIVYDLLKVKMNTPEVGEGKRIDALNDYIDENLISLKTMIDQMPSEHKADWGRLNELFLSVVQ
jgi:predicted nucleotidyltransferase